ncbi:hypothetical protein KY290_010276 [Solanum tuberosum]|uniref:Ulp1 protease family, C-terminal catalytic domain containing protein n=1 Tax=Solanum tuberosum TaxID=4113 RepID=A0ABQ7VXF5_SOLTU|nr:hypothetical protein KY289_012706 [Solanum tuberosum]KAH0773139.1 hypothetical protein KY290_010276 [Solanum tuberosum]
MEEEGGARKSPRRSPRILSDVGTSNQKVYRRSRMRGQVSSPTDEVNDCPNFSLGISQVSGEQNKEQNKEEKNKKQNKDGSEKKKPVKDAKTRNRLPKNVILPESRYSRPELKATPTYSGIDEFEKIEFHFITKGVPRQQDDSLDCEVFVAAFAEFVSNGQHILNQQVKADILRKRFGAILWEYSRRKQASDLQSEDERPER